MSCLLLLRKSHLKWLEYKTTSMGSSSWIFGPTIICPSPMEAALICIVRFGEMANQMSRCLCPVFHTALANNVFKYLQVAVKVLRPSRGIPGESELGSKVSPWSLVHDHRLRIRWRAAVAPRNFCLVTVGPQEYPSILWHHFLLRITWRIWHGLSVGWASWPHSIHLMS